MEGSTCESVFCDGTSPAVVDTRFAFVIVMLKRFLHLKDALERMVISDKWAAYKEDDQEKVGFVRAKILDEAWWDNVKYIVDFTEPIYSMLRTADTNKPCLHLIYETWDSMIEKVKVVVYRNEGKGIYEESNFDESVQDMKDDIMHSCRFYIEKNLGTWDPPNHSLCCQNIRKADVAQICAEFTEADKEKIALHKWVKAARICGNALAVGSNCAGYQVPPLHV
ncbi:hypothetical protein PR202_ga11512 [Eleusine coracana subsp. coracana]|uniref:Uncharacterized protein n=1 Tax=Eleusine coracana subsp. coracana TaxID=191504 RepID=A0AAV5C971_ELECO|nr:hypothetical protein PR202_ga11512 [Eleusine coracana subsp. coracana]